jgi:riboflavin biosynthesis pyrimidine reductase
MTEFRRLYPEPPVSGSAAEMLAELRPGERAPAGRPFVYANFVATVDGRATVEGRTVKMGGPGDLPLLVELRTLADAVLLGPRTIQAEGYARLIGRAERRARRRDLGLVEDPPAVLITRSFALPWDAGLFQAPEQPILVYASEDAPEPREVPAQLEVVRLPEPTPEAALADLHARGVRALLTEGGPTLLHALVHAGLLDELFLTITPLITSDEGAPGILTGPRLPTELPLELLSVLEHSGDVFLRYAAR